jgi:hypothetical protein
MRQLLKHMSEDELLERLASLTEYLASCRGVDASYVFCMMDIEEIQEEIESRKNHPGQNGPAPQPG